jgi:hypothetical protein
VVEDDCWSVRAEAEELRREVALLRGVVAALRGKGERRKLEPTAASSAWRYVWTFCAGVVLAGALAAVAYGLVAH